MGEKWNYTATELHRWLNAQPDFFNRLPKSVEEEIEQIIWWYEKIQKISDHIEEFRASVRRKHQERAEKKARADEIARRLSAEVETEMETARIQALNQEIQRLRVRIDQVIAKISGELAERQRQQAELTAEQKLKNADDVQTWDAFTRLLKGDTKQPINVSMVEQELQRRSEEERLRREFKVFQAKEGTSQEENLAMWEAYKQRLNAPPPSPTDDEPPSTPTVENAPSPQRKREDDEKLKREIELLQAKPSVSEAENLAAWEEFKRQIAPKKKRK